MESHIILSLEPFTDFPFILFLSQEKVIQLFSSSPQCMGMMV